MRTFGPAASAQQLAKVQAAVAELYARLPDHQPVLRESLGLDRPQEVALYQAEIKFKDGQRLRIGATEPGARPPFEWLYELSSDIGEADYFKHYLLRRDDIMFAQRKELTPIDEAEAELILHDLAVAATGLADPSLLAVKRRPRRPKATE